MSDLAKAAEALREAVDRDSRLDIHKLWGATVLFIVGGGISTAFELLNNPIAALTALITGIVLGLLVGA